MKLYPIGSSVLLSDFIGTSIERSAVNLAKQRTKILRALQSLRGERWSSTDILWLYMPSALADFERFILTEYTPLDRHGRPMNGTELTAGERSAQRTKRRDNIFVRLRGMINEGIEMGVLPALDPFAAMPGFAAKYKTATAPQMLTEIARLVREESAGNGVTIHIYLLSLCLGGVDAASVAAIARAVDEESRLVTIPDRSVSMICDDRLRAMLLQLKRELTAAPEAVTDFARNMTALALASDVKLFGGGDLLLDWLCVAAQTKGIACGDLTCCIESLCDRRPGGPAMERMIDTVCNTLLDRVVPRKPVAKKSKWVVAVTSWPDTAQKLQDRIFGVGACAAPADAELARSLKGRTYCPCRTVQVKIDTPAGRRVLRPRVDPRRSVLRNTLFVRADRDLLLQFRRCFPDIWIMRRKGAKEYISVEEAQIQLMKNVLDTFSSVDDIDIVFQTSASSAADYEKGEQVILNHPDFERQTAVIVSIDKERTTSTATYYIVYFSAPNGIRFHLSLPASLITPRPLES